MRSVRPRPTVTSPVPRACGESVLRTDRNAVVNGSIARVARRGLRHPARYRDASLLYDFPSGPAGGTALGPAPAVPPHDLGGVMARTGEWVGRSAPRDASPRPRPPPCSRMSPAGPRWPPLSGSATTPTRSGWRGPGEFEWRRAGATSSTWPEVSITSGSTKFRNKVRTAVRKQSARTSTVEVDRTGRLLGGVSELYREVHDAPGPPPSISRCGSPAGG